MKGKFSIRWLNGFGWGIFVGIGAIAVVHPLAGLGTMIAGIGLMLWTSRKYNREESGA